MFHELTFDLVYWGPMCAVPLSGACIAVYRKARGEDRKWFVLGALWQTLRWGLYFLLAMAVGLIVFCAITGSSQGWLWILFAPWVVAIGEIAGLKRWLNASAAG